MLGLERLFWNIRKRVDNLLHIETFDFDGRDIISNQGRWRTERIAADHIVKWQVFPEMVVDVVEIELKDGTVICWHDKYNDLLSILRKVAKDKQGE